MLSLDLFPVITAKGLESQAHCHVGLICFHWALVYPPSAFESRLFDHYFSESGDRCGHTFETAGGHSQLPKALVTQRALLASTVVREQQ